MPRARKVYCELVARTREVHEFKRRYAYYRAPVRMCRGVAIVLVKLVDGRQFKMCERCFRRENVDRPQDIQWFEHIDTGRSDSLRAQQWLAGLKTRAPEERSSGITQDWHQAPHEIGDVLRSCVRELGISGASAPAADSGPGKWPDHSDALPRSGDVGAYRT